MPKRTVSWDFRLLDFFLYASNGSGSRGKRIDEKKKRKIKSLWHCPCPAQLTSECTRHHGFLILPHLLVPILLVSILCITVGWPNPCWAHPWEFTRHRGPWTPLTNSIRPWSWSASIRSPAARHIDDLRPPPGIIELRNCEQVLFYLCLSSVIVDLTGRQKFSIAGSGSGMLK
jgi:hypothetical protein